MNVEPIFKWNGSQGIINQSSTSIGIILQETGLIPKSDNNYASIITFVPLRLSHAGRYTCIVQSLYTTSKEVHVASKFEKTGIIITSSAYAIVIIILLLHTAYCYHLVSCHCVDYYFL